MANSIICQLTGDQTKCWVQHLTVTELSTPAETSRLLFEAYNIFQNEYGKAFSHDEDTSYAGLDGLAQEILDAREKMRNDKGIASKYRKVKNEDDNEDPGDFGTFVCKLIKESPDRYKTLKSLHIGEDYRMEDALETLCEGGKSKEYYWIDLTHVTEAQYERYTGSLNHEYTVAELYSSDNFPIDLENPDTVGIFGSKQFEAFADLSYGC